MKAITKSIIPIWDYVSVQETNPDVCFFFTDRCTGFHLTNILAVTESTESQSTSVLKITQSPHENE
jgi:hypothetical protein